MEKNVSYALILCFEFSKAMGPRHFILRVCSFTRYLLKLRLSLSWSKTWPGPLVIPEGPLQSGASDLAKMVTRSPPVHLWRGLEQSGEWRLDSKTCLLKCDPLSAPPFHCVLSSSFSVAAFTPNLEWAELGAQAQDALDMPQQQVQGEDC